MDLRHREATPARNQMQHGMPWPHGLPAPMLGLIGRDGAISNVADCLTRSRLVTLTGPGGIGKTQLALAVAHRQAERFTGGVAFIELASVSDHRLVVPTIAMALGLGGTGVEPIDVRLKTLLGDQQILLVLDNFEHLLAAAPDIANVLAECASLHVLVTSRSALHLRGEFIFDVPPLATPPGHAALQTAELADYPAVELFVRQAQASDVTFTLTDANIGAVAEICTRLDGLPLAIELAAARVRVLSPEGVLARLNEQLQFLIGGPRDQPPRLQTMRNAIAWSYNLLDAGQRTFFRRLAVFSGGWTLAAAEAVCEPDEDVLEAISTLVGYSLVHRIAQPDGAIRFSMLEPIRQFALEQLGLSGERDDVRSRHADVYLALVEEAAPHLNWSDQHAWLLRLDAEYDNCRVAMTWLLEQGDAARGLRFCAALSWFWNMRGVFIEGLATVQAFLNLPQAGARTVDRARALAAMAYLLHFLGENESARAVGDEALAISTETDDGVSRMRILISLSVIAFEMEDDARHELLAHELLTTSRSLGDDVNVARALARLGLSALRRGDLAPAALLLDESLALAQRLENPGTTALALGIIGDLHCRSGDLDRAAPAYRDSLNIYVELDYRLPIARGLERLAALACARSQLQRAAQLYATAEARRSAIGSATTGAERAADASNLAAIRAGLTAEQFQTAWDRGQAMSLADALADALETAPEPSVASPASAAGLTPRELDVLRLIAAGQSNKQIAAELYLSTRTVERHITNLYAKIGARGKADATAWALRQGLA